MQQYSQLHKVTHNENLKENNKMIIQYEDSRHLLGKLQTRHAGEIMFI